MQRTKETRNREERYMYELAGGEASAWVCMYRDGISQPTGGNVA